MRSNWLWSPSFAFACPHSSGELLQFFLRQTVDIVIILFGYALAATIASEYCTPNQPIVSERETKSSTSTSICLLQISPGNTPGGSNHRMRTTEGTCV